MEDCVLSEGVLPHSIPQPCVQVQVHPTKARNERSPGFGGGDGATDPIGPSELTVNQRNVLVTHEPRSEALDPRKVISLDPFSHAHAGRKGGTVAQEETGSANTFAEPSSGWEHPDPEPLLVTILAVSREHVYLNTRCSKGMRLLIEKGVREGACGALTWWREIQYLHLASERTFSLPNLMINHRRSPRRLV